MNSLNLGIEKILHWIKNQNGVILLGLVVALLIVSPHIRAWNMIGSEYFRGVYPIFSDDEITYQARIKEVADGNLLLGNPYIKEHKDDPFIMPPLAEWGVASIVTLTGVSVPLVTSASDFVLGFLNFILVYVLFSLLTGTKRIALLYTVLFFIAFLSTFGRPISPQVNALFLWSGLIAITTIYLKEGAASVKLKFMAGSIAGITCFISPYYFTALLAFAGIVFFLQSIREKSFTPLRKNIPWFLAGFLPLALLYAYFHIKASYMPFYDETMSRYGLMHTHIPGSFTNMAIGGLVLAFLIYCRRFLSLRSLTYGVAGILTIFALNWQNIITGTSLQFSSHYLMVTVLFVFLALALIHTEFREQGTKLSIKYKSGVILATISILGLVMHNQIREFTHIFGMPYTRGELRSEQSKMDVFEWLNANTEPESVVLALGGGYDFLIPVYTRNNVYFNFYAALYPGSHAEMEERWLVQHLLSGNMSTTTIQDRQREFWGNRFIDTYQSGESRKKIKAFVTRQEYIPGIMIDDQFLTYMYERGNTLRTESMDQLLSKYTLDYILLSTKYPYYALTKKMLEQLEEVKLVADIDGELLYRRVTEGNR